MFLPAVIPFAASLLSVTSRPLYRRDTVDASLVPEFGVTAGIQANDSASCIGITNSEGESVLIPCQCPPDRDSFIESLSDNVAAGYVINNPSLSVTFPSDNSTASQLDRIYAYLVTLQNLNGTGVGCPASATTWVALQAEIEAEASSSSTAASATATATVTSVASASSATTTTSVASSTNGSTSVVSAASSVAASSSAVVSSSSATATAVVSASSSVVVASSSAAVVSSVVSSSTAVSNSSVTAAALAAVTSSVASTNTTSAAVSTAAAASSSATVVNSTTVLATTSAVSAANSTAVAATTSAATSTAVAATTTSAAAANSTASGIATTTASASTASVTASNVTMDESLVLEFGVTADTNPNGSGSCDGIDGTDGSPILIPCDCPPDRDTFIDELSANVAAGYVLNNPSVTLTFPLDNSTASQLSRIDAHLVTLQNLNGTGVGCPAAATTWGALQKELAAEL